MDHINTVYEITLVKTTDKMHSPKMIDEVVEISLSA